MAVENGSSTLIFSPDGQLCASLSQDGFLRVWDVARNDLRLQQPADLSNPVTALAWEPSVAKEVTGKKRRSRAKGDSSFTVCTELLLGTSNGQVAVLSVSSGERSSLDRAHKHRISSCTWSSNERSRFWTGCEGKAVAEWTTGDSAPVRQWKCKQSASAMCHVPPTSNCDVPRLVTAGRSIFVWDLSTERPGVLKRITGHEYPVTYVKMTATGDLVSAVGDQPADTLLNVWDLSGDSKQVKTARKALALPACPTSLDVSPSQNFDWRCMSTAEDGKVYVFDCSQDEASTKPLHPSATIDITTGDVPSSPVPVLSSKFDSRRATTHIIIGRGSIVAPVFEKLELATDEGDVNDISLFREAPSNVFTAVLPTKKKKSAKGKSEDVTMLGAADVVRPNGKRKRLDLTKPKSLQEQVTELKLDGDGEVGKAKAAAGAPKTGSIAHLLVQALQSNDNALLEDCINNSNEEVVRNTVVRLPSQYVLPFLLAVVHKVQAKPSRGLMLIAWVKAVLSSHASYLMTVPDVAQKLAPLYSLVDARVSVFQRLLSLSGRLDLIMTQITARSKTEETDEQTQQRAIVSHQDVDTEDEDEVDQADANMIWGSDDDDEDVPMNGHAHSSDSEEDDADMSE